MSDKTQLALDALNIYYREKRVNSDDSRKLVEILESGKWRKFQKRREKWFPDYEETIQRLAHQRLLDLDGKLVRANQLADTILSTCNEVKGAIKAKKITCEESLQNLTTTLTQVNAHGKEAKDNLKTFEKLQKALSAKAGEGSSTVKKTKTLRNKADAAGKTIQEGQVKLEQQQNTLRTHQQNMTKEEVSIADLLTKHQTAQTELNGFADARKKLEKRTPEEIIDPTLLDGINASSPVHNLDMWFQQARKSLLAMNEVDTTFVAREFTGASQQLLEDMAELLGQANTLWLTVSKTTELDFYDPRPYYAYYEGIRKHPTSNPSVTGGMQNPFLESSLEEGYVFVKKKGPMVQLKTGDWCRLADFYTPTQRARAIYLNEYTAYLADQFAKMDRLKGQKKLDFIKGILSQAQKVIIRFNEGKPLAVATLDKTPHFDPNPKQVACPHELIRPLRQWVELTEKKIQRVDTESGDNENAGSLYSDIDWNTLLKVPQYRTQSDNLISPETTCAPTTFTMMAERAGWSRTDIIEAIEKRMEADPGFTNLKTAWELKTKAFFTWLNKNASKQYQKIRAGRINNVQLKQLAKEFKRFGQYEDLTIFYHYLLNRNSKTTINSSAIHNQRLRQGIENDGDFKKLGSYKYTRLKGIKKDLDARPLVKEHLDRGDVIMFSIFHKGDAGGTHNYFVQSIDRKGFVLDDPFGRGNEQYSRNRNKRGDLYKDKGGTRSRNEYPFKNTIDFNFSNKDFTTEAAQVLTDSESRGASSLFTWEMMEASNKSIINYVVVWERKKR